MSNSDDLSSVRDTLMTIPDSEVKEPTMPVGIFVQEAEDLAAWATKDIVLLALAGIDAAKLSALKVGAGALRESQSIWVKNRKSMEDAQQQWAEEAPVAFDLRDELLHTFRYAFRNDDALLSRVAEIAEGSGNDDMLQDLNDLAVLGNEHTDLLTAVGCDLALLETAATKADTLAEVLALSNGESNTESADKALRDRAFTYLKSLVDDVRGAGKFKFWKDPKRIKGYYSDYWRKKNASKGKDDDTESSSDTPTT